MELSKTDKKIARQIIEKGLQNEFAKSLSDADTILDLWKCKSINNRDAYQKLYKHIADFDKHIAGLYDRMTGSNYIFIIAAQLNNAVISEEDIIELSENTQQSIKLIADLSKQ